MHNHVFQPAFMRERRKILNCRGYKAPAAALKKLRAAKGIGQIVYIYGAAGYGKTELVRQYLSKRRYQYISCGEDTAGLLEAAASGGVKAAGTQPVVVVDDIHLLKGAEGSPLACRMPGHMAHFNLPQPDSALADAALCQ